MRNALGSVHIPVFEDLQARVGAAGECGADCGSAARARADAGAGIEGGGMEPGCSNPSPNQEVEVETLKPILATLRRALTPWCQLMLRTALAGPHLGWLTHLGNEPFSFWCRFLLRVVPIEDGGDVVTREEKLAALETMSELMVVVSWSWSASFELPIRQEILKTVEEIKLAIALDRERLLAAASASESGSAGLYTTPPSNLSSSPGTSASAGRSNYGGQGDGEGDTQRQNRRRRFEGQYVLPAALELPNVEAIMREAGVMDIVEGASGLARVCYAPLRDSGGRVGGVISGKESVYVPLLDGGVEGGSGALYPSADATTGASISTQSMHVQATMPEPTYEQSLWSDEYSFVPLDGAAFVSAPGMQTVVQEDAGFPQSQEHGQLDGGVSGQGWDELGMDQDFWATLGAGNDGAGDVYGSGEGTAGYYRGV
ncbi:hypothetical protein CONPUDRAFT_139542 [Coniophora puteana RWD-64-598 SS2]|uniref:Uncharacterized protein n=1 Tax=Coniophora puteana (strain RWD-64-598) TaxID=741705 RepID=A0A5M3MDA4_CONPW|nr:uncharacterized protein CONPUDRAFT_139542 [Coniophora puteana RWD-64-598 SS2]EIW76966.1 hypothetical protein CONPUDRAFT_139542 [Coniophora puteana RWD-64-598 SS2]